MNVKLLKDLDFVAKINECQAVSEAGKELVKNYKAYLFTNPASCGIVNGFVQEAQKYGFDTGLASILESVLGFIKENNISWQLASACESIENNKSTYNYIAKTGVEQVSKLLEMDESQVVSYIKSGALKGVQYIPEFRQVCKEVYKQTITETQAVNYNVVNPVSYVYVSEEAKFFNVCGKTFKTEDGIVSESVCNDVTYNKINSLLEHFEQKNDKLNIGLKDFHGNTYTFSIDENGIDLTRNGFGKEINEHFADAANFNEYCNTLSKIMNVNEKLQFMNTVSVVSEMFNASNQIVSLDNVKLLNANNGTLCAIIEGEKNVNLTVFRNVKHGTSSQNYDYVVEALNQVIKLTGIDLKAMFEDRINEDLKKLDPEAEEMKKQIEENNEAKFELRKKKIAMLAEQFKNDPVRLSLLNKVAKDLAILEKK